MDKATYRQRKAAGLCPNCNCKNDRPGKVFCTVCAKKRRGYYLKTKPLTNFERWKANLTVDDFVELMGKHDCAFEPQVCPLANTHCYESKYRSKQRIETAHLTCIELLRQWANEKGGKHE